MRKLLVTVLGVLVLAGAAIGYVVSARTGASVNAVPVQNGTIELGPDRLYFRNTATGPDEGKLASLPSRSSASSASSTVRLVGGLKCDRFALAQGTGICLALQPGVLPPITDVVVVGRDMSVVYKKSLPGTPSRARVSPDGKIVYWTVFVTGDSYAVTGFSTRAGLYDLEKKQLIKSIEEMAMYVDGRRYHSSDINYWGITFAGDGNRFYATMSSKGKTHLVEADYQDFNGKAMLENVECPALSPDEKRIAFKQRNPDGTWRLAVVDLATRKIVRTAETGNVDDQPLWRDNSTLLYGLTGSDGGSDIWSVPADGSGAPVLVVPDAASPAVLSR